MNSAVLILAVCRTPVSYELRKLTLLSVSSRSSVDRGPAQCSGGHGFDSCRELRFFFVPRSCHVEYLIFHILCGVRRTLSSLSTLVESGTNYFAQPQTKGRSRFQISSIGEFNLITNCLAFSPEGIGFTKLAYLCNPNRSKTKNNCSSFARASPPFACATIFACFEFPLVQ